MSHDQSHKGDWIPAKKIQPEDFEAPFEVRFRIDPPPGLEFWDQPLWVFGRCEGQQAEEHPTIKLTHHAEDREGHKQRDALPLKILYPVLIDFAPDIAEQQLLLKIDLRNLEVRPTLTPEAAKVKADRRKYPAMVGHGWKNGGP
jgi:hypothetical protein